MRWRSLPIALFLALIAHSQAQDLPVKSDSKDLQREAAELIEGLPKLTDIAPAPTTPAPALSVDQAKTRLDQAHRKQERWEKLARQGVLSRVEAERCVIEVATAQLAYERACYAEALSTGDPAAAEACKIRTTAAEAELRQTRLSQAQTNLGRFRRLYAERLVTKSQMERAETLVKNLEAQAAP